MRPPRTAIMYTVVCVHISQGFKKKRINRRTTNYPKYHSSLSTCCSYCRMPLFYGGKIKNCNNSISEKSLIRSRHVRNAWRRRRTHLSPTRITIRPRTFPANGSRCNIILPKLRRISWIRLIRFLDSKHSNRCINVPLVFFSVINQKGRKILQFLQKKLPKNWWFSVDSISWYNYFDIPLTFWDI